MSPGNVIPNDGIGACCPQGQPYLTFNREVEQRLPDGHNPV